MRRLLILGCLLASACTAALPIPAPTATPEPTPTPRVTLRSVGIGYGLTVDVPVGWSLIGVGSVNRATQRQLLASNVDVATLPTVYGNGDVDAAQLLSGQVTVEIETFCRFSCQGPTDETPLPLDWANARPVYERQLPAGRHELGLGFRYFDRPMFVMARWVDDAPAADIAAIAEIARSVRADPPPPATGEYRGWAGLGPLADLPAGGVRLVPLPAGAIERPPYSTWDNEPFFIVRVTEGVIALSSKPLVDRRCTVAFDPSTDHFTCTLDDRTVSWTRRGTYLGPEPASDMRQFAVVVRDGSFWVEYSY